jgi:3-hydroxybutyryl-CoA dehydrogenase
MVIAVKATQRQKEEWLAKPSEGGAAILWVEDGIPEADAYFDLCFEEYGPAFSNIENKPVFVNAVLSTLADLSPGAIRINAWNGFLQRDVIEVVAADGSVAAVETIFNALGLTYRLVPDVPGMIAARTIGMIINEAYFALGDEVSGKADIDTAMKLGTNYPYGPFEWSAKIGLHNIYRLLTKLAETDPRYAPAPAMEQELKTLA